MENTYPATWWLMTALASCLAGYLFCGHSWLWFIIVTLIAAGGLVYLSERYRKRLVARTQSVDGMEVRVYQQRLEGPEQYLGTLSEAELNQLKLNALLATDFLPRVVARVLRFALSYCRRSLSALPKAALWSAFLLLMFSPDSLAGFIHWLQHAGVEEMVTGAHKVMVNLLPIYLLVVLVLIPLLHFSTLPESPVTEELYTRLQRRFNTGSGKAFVLVTMDYAESGGQSADDVRQDVSMNQKPGVSAENIRSGVNVKGSDL